MSGNDDLIEPIRDASRRLVRELGFMRATVAGTDFSASAVHAIIEIGGRGSLTASQLGAILRLEKSSVSRMVHKLTNAGEIGEKTDTRDSRVKHLSLTRQGRKTRREIDKFARSQVARALAALPNRTAMAILHGLRTYAEQLGDKNSDRPPGFDGRAVTIETGYRPGIIGQAVEMQARYYAAAAGLGQTFERGRAIDIARFADRLDRPVNQLWCAVLFGTVVGTIAIDGEDMAPAAHLRWFIVDDHLRGRGIGRRLLGEAIAFCHAKKFAEVRLETFKGLEAARRLYDEAGFVVVREEPGRKWGAEVVEQTMVKRFE